MAHFGGLDEQAQTHQTPCARGATDTCSMTAPRGLGGDYPPGAGAMRTGRHPSGGNPHPSIPARSAFIAA